MRKKAFSASIITLVILLLLSTVTIVTAQNDITDDDVNEVASKLFCPTCEAIPVDVCPTEVCGDWRDEIRRQLEAGQTEREILDDFAARYGSSVLANPPPRGIGLFVWIAPAMVAIFGSSIFVWQMRRLNTGQNADSTPPSGNGTTTIPKDDYRRRLEEELK